MVHRLRQDVFVRELNGALPDDSEDAASVHFTATDDVGHVVGAARLQADGEISAIAVVPECRRRGIAHGLSVSRLRHLSISDNPDVGNQGGIALGAAIRTVRAGVLSFNVRASRRRGLLDDVVASMASRWTAI